MTIKFNGSGKDGYLILEEGNLIEATRDLSFKGIDMSRGGTLKMNGFKLEATEYILFPENGKKGGIEL